MGKRVPRLAGRRAQHHEVPARLGRGEQLGRPPADRVARVEGVAVRRKRDPDGPRNGAEPDAELEEVGIAGPPLPQPARLGGQAAQGGRMGMDEGGQPRLPAGGGAQLLALPLQMGQVAFAGRPGVPAGRAPSSRSW